MPKLTRWDRKTRTGTEIEINPVDVRKVETVYYANPGAITEGGPTPGSHFAGSKLIMADGNDDIPIKENHVRAEEALGMRDPIAAPDVTARQRRVANDSDGKINPEDVPVVSAPGD